MSLKNIPVVTEMQICGLTLKDNLADAFREYLRLVDNNLTDREKINFSVRLPNGKTKSITIRQEEGVVVAYGDFEGLPDALEYAQEITGKGGE